MQEVLKYLAYANPLMKLFSYNVVPLAITLAAMLLVSGFGVALKAWQRRGQSQRWTLELIAAGLMWAAAVFGVLAMEMHSYFAASYDSDEPISGTVPAMAMGATIVFAVLAVAVVAFRRHQRLSWKIMMSGCSLILADSAFVVFARARATHGDVMGLWLLRYELYSWLVLLALVVITVLAAITHSCVRYERTLELRKRWIDESNSVGYEPSGA